MPSSRQATPARAEAKLQQREAKSLESKVRRLAAEHGIEVDVYKEGRNICVTLIAPPGMVFRAGSHTRLEACTRPWVAEPWRILLEDLEDPHGVLMPCDEPDCDVCGDE